MQLIVAGLMVTCSRELVSGEVVCRSCCLQRLSWSLQEWRHQMHESMLSKSAWMKLPLVCRCSIGALCWLDHCWDDWRIDDHWCSYVLVLPKEGGSQVMLDALATTPLSIKKPVGLPLAHMSIKLQWQQDDAWPYAYCAFGYDLRHCWFLQDIRQPRTSEVLGCSRELTRENSYKYLSSRTVSPVMQ